MTQYCDTNASGADDGTSWTDAFNTGEPMQRGLTASSDGEEIWVEEFSAETYAVAKTITGGSLASPRRVIRKSSADDSYAPTDGTDTINYGTTTSNDHITISGSIIFEGIHIRSGGDLSFTIAATSPAFVDSAFGSLIGERGVNLGVSTADVAFYAKGSLFQHISGTALVMHQNNPVRVEYDDCTWKGTVRTNGLFQGNSADGVQFTCRNCDLDPITGSPVTLCDISSVTDGFFYADFIACRFPDAAVLDITDGVFTNDGQVVTLWASDPGSDIYPLELHVYRGDIFTDTTTFLTTNGYVDADGDTNLSHSMEPSSVVTIGQPLVGIEILEWQDSVATVAVVVECYEDHTVALTKAQFWMEVAVYDGTDTLVTTFTTQVRDGLPASAADLDSSAAAWTSASGGREVKLEITGITVGRVGFIKTTLYSGIFESGKTVLVTPRMAIS